jgi:uncharacterized membrane protein YecN with MAPEG domain
MISMPITLLTAAAAFFLNVWLGYRIAQFRRDFKVSVGDGGHEPLLRRMRAQSNFIENAPFFLILLGSLELSGASRTGLGLIAFIFILSRIAHGYGMDGGNLQRWRQYGIMATTFTTLALSFWAIVVAAKALSGR